MTSYDTKLRRNSKSSIEGKNFSEIKKIIRIIKNSMKTIYEILKLPIRNKLGKKLGDWLKFYELCIINVPRTPLDARQLFMNITKKATHEFFDVEYFFVVLQVFLEKLYNYIEIYNSIKKPRDTDKEIYTSFSDILFPRNTPCFEATFEQLQNFPKPMEKKPEAATIQIDFIKAAKLPLIKKLKKILKKITPEYLETNYLDSSYFFQALVFVCFAKFLCYYFDSVCDKRDANIKKSFNIENLFNFIEYFNFKDDFEQLSEIYMIDDLIDILKENDISLEEGIYFNFLNICCFDDED